ncbi:Nucleoporin Nup43 [Rhizophlyctis rosea]|uniref:Nucleoporin Nup43 n=1 Tax=Rhizophlyctis rosea TaxID=64517 RepID=A0AAD5SJ19_9FUNG|nr:Nucleoporin Nup43 [Rhizophlyctis rosea]
MLQGQHLFERREHDQIGKVSKVRWGPTPVHQSSLILATGTYNGLKSSISISQVLLDPQSANPLDISHAAAIPVKGDVTDLRWVPGAGPLTLISATSSGIIDIHSVAAIADRGKRETIHVEPLNQFTTQGGEGVGISALAVQPHAASNPWIASVGVDASISFQTAEGKEVQKRMENVEAIQITGLEWRTSNEIAIATSAGHIRQIDARSRSKGLPLSSHEQKHRVPLNCITVHPTQPDKLATGAENGELQIWDVRNLSDPELTILPAHDGNVWDVRFHPTSANDIATCSEDGTVCVMQWREPTSSVVDTYKPIRRFRDKNHPLGINSVDIHSEKDVLVAAGDLGCTLMTRLSRWGRSDGGVVIGEGAA